MSARPGAAAIAAAISAPGRDFQLPGRHRVLRRAGLVRLADRRHLAVDRRDSSTDLQFPMWIYYLALPVGSALMLLRYIMRLVRFTLYFDRRR